ncbi:MAG: tRNA lysidine(34) synthetase TilS [Lachnospiraceae bacterium]|nr:tRNA lysidine(34) synthetase TilS [Lachnospiraceae bacterium]
MYKRICEFVKENNLILDGDSIIVGVSGGADSVCLLDVLLALKSEIDYEVYAVHINHGIRGQAALEDEIFVKELCKEYDVDLSVYKKNVPEFAKANHLTEEEAGRFIRYECFEQEMRLKNANKIAVAHHKNDNAETVLINLFRGSGLEGLKGMQPKNNNIIRPLLCCQRKEIEEYLSSKNISYCTDATNFLNDYTRNKIRNNIISYAQDEINSSVVDNILAAAETVNMALEFISKYTNKAIEKCVILKEKKTVIDNNIYKEFDDITRMNIIRYAIDYVDGLRDIGRVHILLVDKLKDMESGKTIDLPKGIVARKEYDNIIIEKVSAKTNEPPKIDYEIIEWSGSEIIENCDYTKLFDYDKIVNRLEVRTRKDGDYFITNNTGGKKKLKDYFIDIKVPRQERDNVYLLADGNHVLWIIGYRISEAYKIEKNTKRVLKVTAHLEKEKV